MHLPRGLAIPTLFALGVLLFGAAPPQAEDVLHWADSHWRLEFQGAGGVHSGSIDRIGDSYFTGSIEYEVPAFKRSSFGLKLLPLFVYDESVGAGSTIYGGGIGITHRIYEHAETRSGFFADIGISALLHSDEFLGNGSQLNFLSEGGIGYKWTDSPWHLSVKASHISNASLDRDNAGINAVLLAAGYTF